MKKIFLLLFFASNFIVAQNITKEQLIKKLTQETCDCAEKNKATKENFESVLGLCIAQITKNNNDAVEKYYGKDYLTNKPVMYGIGKEIGKNMVTTCPDIMLPIIQGAIENKKITSEMIQKSADEDEETEPAPEVVDPTVTGKFLGTKIDGFLYVTVKEESGKINQLALVNNFENAYLILDKVLKPNQKVEVSYFDGELFDVKTNKYINVKVLSDIKKL
jgi:hypothetical protein